MSGHDQELAALLAERQVLADAADDCLAALAAAADRLAEIGARLECWPRLSPNTRRFACARGPMLHALRLHAWRLGLKWALASAPLLRDGVQTGAGHHAAVSSRTILAEIEGVP